jgi:hypothetical protein
VSFDVALVLANGKVTLAKLKGDVEFSVNDAEPVKFGPVWVSFAVMFLLADNSLTGAESVSLKGGKKKSTLRLQVALAVAFGAQNPFSNRISWTLVNTAS